MKKSFTQLLILMICFCIGPYTYGQKKKSTKIDSFYFEVPNSKNLFFKVNTPNSADSLQVASYSYYTNSLFNSEKTDFSLTRSIQLDNHSGEKTIPVEIRSGSPEFLLSVNCDLQSGILTVEIYDPTGVKRGSFSVKGNSDNKTSWSESVGGVINKRFINPIKGTWSLKFIAEKVSATILINTQIK